MGRLARVKGTAGVAILAVVVAIPILTLRIHVSAAQQPGGEATVYGSINGVQIDRPDDANSPGRLRIGTTVVTLPAGLVVQFPGTTLSLRDLYAQAPARCRERGESGLVTTDACRHPVEDTSGRSPIWSAQSDLTPRSRLDPVPTGDASKTLATVVAERDLHSRLTAKTAEFTRNDRSVWGAVTFINEEEGYLRINGAYRQDVGGAILRVNDPEGRISSQNGTGCGAEGNCSPDVRFKIGTGANPTVSFAEGYAACVPAGAAGGCDSSARPVRVAPAANAVLPIAVGDHVTAIGGFDVNRGTRVFWAHTLVVQTAVNPEE